MGVRSMFMCMLLSSVRQIVLDFVAGSAQNLVAVPADLVVDLVMVAVFALQAAELLALPPAQGRSALQAAAPALLFDDVCHVVWSV